jgi:hypothetical protein
MLRGLMPSDQRRFGREQWTSTVGHRHSALTTGTLAATSRGQVQTDVRQCRQQLRSGRDLEVAVVVDDHLYCSGVDEPRSREQDHCRQRNDDAREDCNCEDNLEHHPLVLL